MSRPLTPKQIAARLERLADRIDEVRRATTVVYYDNVTGEDAQYEDGMMAVAAKAVRMAADGFD